MKHWTLHCLMLTGALLVLGCGGEQASNEPAAAEGEAEAPSGAQYVLAAEPQDAKGVIEVRANARNDDNVVVVGRIGGRLNPWIADRAAFSIVDPSLVACNDNEGDNCAAPWDYCCETDKLPDATVLVKVVDESGNLVAVDAKKLLGVKELQTVVVQGKASRDDAQNLTILASGIFVRP